MPCRLTELNKFSISQEQAPCCGDAVPPAGGLRGSGGQTWGALRLGHGQPGDGAAGGVLLEVQSFFPVKVSERTWHFCGVGRPASPAMSPQGVGPGPRDGAAPAFDAAHTPALAFSPTARSPGSSPRRRACLRGPHPPDAGALWAASVPPYTPAPPDARSVQPGAAVAAPSEASRWCGPRRPDTDRLQGQCRETRRRGAQRGEAPPHRVGPRAGRQ
jgi:hypothetical protein